MTKRVFLAFILLTCVGQVVCLAEEIVTTADGRKVLLKDDQTWEYCEEDFNEEDATTVALSR